MKHNVFVQVWCEIDSTLNLRVDRQTSAPVADNGDLLTRISPLGRFGVTEALRIPDSEVTVFALGDGHEDAMRHALAAGAKRALRIQIAPSLTEAGDIIACLAEWLNGQRPAITIMDRLAGQLAARLGWAHLAGLDHLGINRRRLSAFRHLDRGAKESVTAKLPTLVRLQTDTPELQYVSREKIAQAGSLPIEEITITASTPSPKTLEAGPLQISRPRTRLGAAVAPAPAKGMDRLNALMGIGTAPVAKALKPSTPIASEKTPTQLADEFVRYLAHHDLLGGE